MSHDTRLRVLVRAVHARLPGQRPQLAEGAPHLSRRALEQPAAAQGKEGVAGEEGQGVGEPERDVACIEFCKVMDIGVARLGALQLKGRKLCRSIPGLRETKGRCALNDAGPVQLPAYQIRQSIRDWDSLLVRLSPLYKGRHCQITSATRGSPPFPALTFGVPWRVKNAHLHVAKPPRGAVRQRDIQPRDALRIRSGAHHLAAVPLFQFLVAAYTQNKIK